MLRIIASGVETSIASMHPGDTVKLKINNNKGVAREIKIKLGSREEDEVSIAETDKVTPQQRARRAAWLAGEAERPHP